MEMTFDFEALEIPQLLGAGGSFYGTAFLREDRFNSDDFVIDDIKLCDGPFISEDSKEEFHQILFKAIRDVIYEDALVHEMARDPSGKWVRRIAVTPGNAAALQWADFIQECRAA